MNLQIVMLGGVVGANVVGWYKKHLSLGMLWNSVVGIWGGLFVAILQEGLSLFFVNIIGVFVSSCVGGGLLLAAVGLIKKRGRNELFVAVKDGDYKKVLSIINRPDCDINLRDSGLTALMWAANLGHTKIVQELINKGAGLDLLNDSGWSALMASAQQGHEEIVEMLISAGAKVDFVDAGGWNALMRAKQSGNRKIISALKSAGAEFSPGARWCPGCETFIKSRIARLRDMGMKNVIASSGNPDFCQDCGSQLESA